MELKQDQRRDEDHLAGPLGAFAPIVAAGLLVPIRELVHPVVPAGVLVVVVVVVAYNAGRFWGCATAVVAALSFNFFLTEPYLLLEMQNREDQVVAAVLLVVGLIAGSIVGHGRSRSTR